jgi:hypothetical protein
MPAFSDIFMRLVCVKVTAIYSNSLVLVGCFVCSVSSIFSTNTVATISIGRQMCYEMNPDTNNWQQVTEYTEY